MLKKQILNFIVGLIILLAASQSVATARSENLVDIVLEPPIITGEKGETFKLTIKAIPNSQKMAAMDIFLDFDPAYLEVVDANPDKPRIQIEPGNILTLLLATEVDNSNGEIAYCAGMPLGTDSPDDAFTVASVTLRIKADAIGTTALTFHTEMPRQTMVAYKGNSVLGALSGAEVTVEATPTPVPPIVETEPAPTPVATTTPVPTPVPVLTETPRPTPETSAGFAKWIPLIIGLVVVLGLGSFIMVRRRG